MDRCTIWNRIVIALKRTVSGGSEHVRSRELLLFVVLCSSHADPGRQPAMFMQQAYYS